MYWYNIGFARAFDFGERINVYHLRKHLTYIIIS